jgi:hypothetical protein
MGQVQMKDGTAMGVAKVRHWEALHEEGKRMYHDPYAQQPSARCPVSQVNRG